MKKILISMMAVLVLISAVYAESLQPMACDTFTPDTEFSEGDSVCFYGVGYDETEVDISLQNTDSGGDDYFLADVQTNNGVLSSVFNAISGAFEDVKAGIYRMIVTLSGKEVEFGDDVIVNGETSGDDDPEDVCLDDCREDFNPEVPEFSTIAAGGLLVGIGYFIHKKRSEVLK